MQALIFGEDMGRGDGDGVGVEKRLAAQVRSSPKTEVGVGGGEDGTMHTHVHEL